MVIGAVALPGGPSFKVASDSLGGLDPVAEDLALGSCALFAESWPLLRSLLRPGLTVLDLGAHQGSFALPAAVLGCRVLAVEASSANVELLRCSAELNGPVQLEIVHAAVSDRAGEVLFRQRGPWGWVVTDDIRGDVNVQRVRAVTVDDLLSEHGIYRVDVVKMDIEGSEVAGLRGMTRLLTRSDPPIVFYESNGYTLDVFGETCQSLKAALAQVGFQTYYVDSSGGRLVPVEPADMQPDCVVDYLAVKSNARAGALRSLAGRRRGSIGAWPVARRLDRADWLSWLRSACEQAVSVEQRSHLVRELARAPRWARDDDVVSRFLHGAVTQASWAVR